MLTVTVPSFRKAPVSDVDKGEPSVRGRAAAITVGMMLQAKLAIGVFDLFGTVGVADTEYPAGL